MSFDSRMFGPVDIDLIVGRAAVVIWPPSSMSTL
jgi:type IV secretory pathway protease TraF